MTNRMLYLTETDMDVLRHLIDWMRMAGSGQEQYLRDLESELDRAQVVKAGEMPSGVVTLHSAVKLRDLDTGEVIVCVLTLPDEANIDQGMVSVLAPIGTAMLGYRERDVVEWPVPAGMRRFKIIKVRQMPVEATDTLSVGSAAT